MRSQLLELVILVAASREDYSTQAALLIEAWKSLARVPEAERDAWVAASSLRNLAQLVWDLTLVLASDDRRQTAMEHDAQAAVLAAEGRADEAVAMRRRALATWDDLDHLWRAARSAVALARLTGTDHDTAAALMRTKTFRCSWLGRAAAAVHASRRARANRNR